MIRQFVTVEEFEAAHPVGRYGGTDPRKTIRQKLSSAEREVREILRIKDTLTRRLQVPQMLSGTYAVKTMASSDTTGSSCAIQGTRYVVECFTDASATFYLLGSEDGTNWRNVYDRMTGTYIQIDATGAGIYSAPFAEAYTYYKYKVETDSAIEFLPYLVDSSVDMLIEYKALELLYEDHLGDDLADGKHSQAVSKFDSLINTFSADIDIDGDGAIDDSDRNAKQVHRFFR